MAGHQQIINSTDLSSVFLPEDSPILRQRPRPAKLRQPTYDQEFDFRCMFYDVFFSEDNRSIHLVGPPLLNLKRFIQEGTIEVLDPSSNKRAAIEDCAICDLRKVSRLDIRLKTAVQQATCCLDLGALGKFNIPVNDNLADMFASKNVAFTLFKYEPIEWLYDWAEFNVRYHGVNALVINHNTCPHATSQQIIQALQPIANLDILMVVHWPYLYGPQAAGTGRWDSNFCQLGLFEQMRRRYFSKATAVFNSDIDELVVTEAHRPLFSLLEESSEGYMQIDCVAVSDGATHENMSTFDTRRHRDHFFVGELPTTRGNKSKWILAPQQNGEENQWLVHRVAKRKTDNSLKACATLCHFNDINVKWKHATMHPLENQREYPLLKSAFQKVGWHS